MIFRIHSNPPIDIKGWGSRGNKLSDDAIKTISDDLVEGNAAKVATSIPNPFARMYLFETAFQMVKDGRHAGNSLYHQLVSDCLDVFQLLFMMGPNNKHIRFKKWSCDSNIQKLKERGTIQVSGKTKPHPHKLLGDSLELFLKSHRFDGFSEIYFIYYKDILLGGTSPLTIFYTSPNFQRLMIQNNIPFPPSKSTDILFDTIPAALHERDVDFQEYMHKFRLAFKENLSTKCPSLSQYIMSSGERHNSAILSSIGGDYDQNKLFAEYEKINFDQSTMESVSAGVFSVLKQPGHDVTKKIKNNSGFVMECTVDHYKNYTAEDGEAIELSPPLALVSNCDANVLYIHDVWETDTVVEYMANKQLHERVLPKTDNTIYPFITTEDFLEDKLVKMPYSLNNENFFTGHPKFEYLLPVKKEYFNFFTLTDLEKHLQINNDHEKVIINLRIPIRDGNFIEIKKIYDKNLDVYKPEDSTLGFGMGIFPFYKVTDKVALNDYTILLVDNTEEETDLNFYRFSKIINNQPLNYSNKVRQPKTNDSAGSIYYRINNNEQDNSFDLIEVSCGVYQGVIIPKFNQITVDTHTKKFNFAIDFGTSNTHIAYNSTEDPSIKSFDITLKDIQMVMLNSRGNKESNYKNLGESFDWDFGDFYEMIVIKNRAFVPSIIGNDSNIKYPVRTATCESNHFQAEAPNLFGNINIGYHLDAEEKILDHTHYMTNIKWGMEKNLGGIPEQNRVEKYFEQIAWMIKNKILLNGGTLDPNISWFVPISMKMPIRSILADLWTSSINSVFGEEHLCRIKQETESTVPYFYLKNVLNLFDTDEALNIDIGGGTIDLIYIVSSQGKKSYSTSFKYAANDIWGDGITHAEGAVSPKDNGFFLMIKDKIDNGDINLDTKTRNCYQTFYNNAIFDSADMISFLFKYDKSFNFTNSIKAHPYLPTLLFLHYSSIIYHASQIIQDKNIVIPMHITFTGKGSEYIKIIFPNIDSRSKNTTELDKYTGLLLTKFTGKQLPGRFKVNLIDNPKEVTANGGISMFSTNSVEIDPEEIIHHGYKPEDKPEDVEIGRRLKNKDLDVIQEAVLKNIEDFLDILIFDDELNEFFQKYDIKFQFGDENLKQKVQRYAPHCFNQIKSNLINSGTPDELIEESPFFWGLKEVFYRLSQELYDIGD